MLIEADAPEVERKVVVVDWGPSPGRAVYALRLHRGLSSAEVRTLTSSTNVVVAVRRYFDIDRSLVHAFCRAGAKLEIVPVSPEDPESPM